MNPLEAYLREMRDIRATGAAVAETSYYPALSNLLNEIGKSLKPKVRSVITIANRGAGLPDGGLFTADQFQKKTDAKPDEGQLPGRGAIEVKAPATEIDVLDSAWKVKKYLPKYGLLVLTNYRGFLLVGRDALGHPLPMEAYTLASDEPTFWAAAAHPQKTATVHGERFCEYLKRVMLSVAPLSAPQDVAWFLASYARDAKARMAAVDLPALANVRVALEEGLGMKFTGEKGEHFFRSTLVQTIFYGVFSAWVLWHRERPGRTDAFDWRTTAWSLRVPFIRALYDEVATPSRLGPLGLVEVLDWTAAALNRVDRAAFFQKFQDEHAVQYFYEPFLEAFDPELRKELGVWYTPPEIVQYQVARVDTVLREELGLLNGLADQNVMVFDPCCGTGTYLLEVLKKIRQIETDLGMGALVGILVQTASMDRVFGFETRPFAFLVANATIGDLIHETGLSYDAGKSQRPAAFLANPPRGIRLPDGPDRFLFVKMPREKPWERDGVLVVLGNPLAESLGGDRQFLPARHLPVRITRLLDAHSGGAPWRLCPG